MIIELRRVKMKERTIILCDGDDDAWGKCVGGSVRLMRGKVILAVVV